MTSATGSAPSSTGLAAPAPLLGMAGTGAPKPDSTSSVQITPMTAEGPGSPGFAHWAGLGAVTVGTAFAGVKAQTWATPEKKAEVAARYADLKRFQGSSPEIQARAKALQSARSGPSTMTSLKEATQGPRTVARQFASKSADKVAAKGLVRRSVVNVGRAAGTRLLPKAATLGARIGLRMAVFAVPGPGWLLGAGVLAATWLFDDDMRRFMNNLVGRWFGVSNSPAIDAPPEPPRTQFLPLTHDGNRDSVIDAKDAEMVTLNNAAFMFDPNKVWHPTSPAIETTSTFETSTQKVTDLMTATAALRDELDSILRKYQYEQVVAKAADSLKQARDSLTQFDETILPAVANLITVTANDVNGLYLKLRDANNAARQEISNSGAGLLPGSSSVDASKMGSLPDDMKRFADKQGQDIKAADAVFTDWKPAASASSTGAGNTMLDPPPLIQQSEQRPRMPLPGAGGGGHTLPGIPDPGKSKADGPSKQEILDSLRGLGTPTTPPTVTPTPPNSVPPMNNPFGQMGANPFGQMGANPFGQMNPLGQPGGANATSPLLQPNSAASKPDPAKLESKLRNLLGTDKAKDAVGAKDVVGVNDKTKDEAVKDDTPPISDVAKAEPPAPVAKATPAPTTPSTLSTVLGTDTPPPGAPGDDAQKSKSVQIGGKTVDFEDPRSARMTEILKPTDGSVPVSVQDAATQAGYHLPPAGHDIGDRVQPANLRPGDVIMGADDRNGIYLGDSKVLSGGEVRPIGDIAHFTAEDGQGIFRLDDSPAPPAGEQQAPAADGATPDHGGGGDGHQTPVPDPGTPAPSGHDPAPGHTPPAATEAAKPADVPDADAPPAPVTAGMPLPRTTTPTSGTATGTAPAAPTVPIGD